MKVMYPPLLSSHMSAVAQKLNESLKKKNVFPFPFYKVRRPSELEVMFMLKIIILGERRGKSSSQRTSNTIGQGRGSIKNDDDDEDNDHAVFY